MHFLVDPFFWFCFSAVVVPPFWVGHNQQQTIEYFTDPFIVGCVGFTVLVIILTQYVFKRGNVALSAFDEWRARWYLLNGTIIHVLLDGFVGAFKVNKTLAGQYAILDSRYVDHGPLGMTLHAISCIELAIYGPACVWLYWAYWKGKAYRASLEVFVAAFQLYGTLVYISTEHLNGYKSFTFWDKRGEWWSLDTIFYLYFAIFFGVALWIIVPAWLILVSFGETATIAGADAAKNKIKNIPGKLKGL